MAKERIDLLLVRQGFCDSRPKARAEIMAGNILVDHQKVEKAGAMVDEDSVITVLKKDFPYVSRGALKLLKALDAFQVSPKGKRCMDIGASTGGFTEVLLERGATSVAAVDVGYNQLAWKLREDPRVIVMEKTNGRNLTPDAFGGQLFDLIVTDVSFISLEKILQASWECLEESGEMIALIKPQFEAGKGEVSRKGIVTDPKTHQKVIRRITFFAVEEVGFSALSLERSPLKGPKGNVEFLLHLRKDGQRLQGISEDVIHEVVMEERNDA